jgi:hypothetical protein
MPDDSQERLVNLRAIELRLKGELDEARAGYERANREFEMHHPTYMTLVCPS